MELQASLEDLNLQEYLNRLIKHGFDTWDSLTAITESDMANLGMKIGHRRRLQREIATRKGYPTNQPLLDPIATIPQERRTDISVWEHIAELDYRKKRRKRSVLRDAQGHSEPNSGYAAYARFLCQDPTLDNLSLIDIEKHVTQRWSSLTCAMKDMWNTIAVSEKSTHISHVAQYQKRDTCCTYDNCSKSANLREDQYDGHIKCRSGPAEDATTLLEFVHQPSAVFALENFTASIFPSGSGLPNDGYNLSVIQSIWTSILKEQVLHPVMTNKQLTHNDLLSFTFPIPANSKSFHVMAINPFAVQQERTIWPMIDNFLRNLNSIYYLVNPDKLRKCLHSALDITQETPNLIMSMVCICIALGCQTSNEDLTDMAIMWYENSRRYLDDYNWCLDPAVMQVLALISMFHMTQRPATASHYLGAAIRIGEANDLHKSIEHENNSHISQWVDIWDTMQTISRVLHLGYGLDDSTVRISQVPPAGIKTIYRQHRARPTVAITAFSELSGILGYVQQYFNSHNKDLPQQKRLPFMQMLKTWLYNLPEELKLPMIIGTQCWNPNMIKNVFSEASDGHKIELLHIHSLYFSAIGLLTTPLLQQIMEADTKLSPSRTVESKSYAYECLSSAVQFIDLCTAFSRVSPFPIYASLPQNVLFKSSLACILGIVWHRQLLFQDTASQAWLTRSHHGIRGSLIIFGNCATRNELAQRHYAVLQHIFGWLQCDIYDSSQFTAAESVPITDILTV